MSVRNASLCTVLIRTNDVILCPVWLTLEALSPAAFLPVRPVSSALVTHLLLWLYTSVRWTHTPAHFYIKEYCMVQQSCLTFFTLHVCKFPSQKESGVLLCSRASSRWSHNMAEPADNYSYTQLNQLPTMFVLTSRLHPVFKSAYFWSGQLALIVDCFNWV